uniref:Uncharacterized protein n=1 Tax=Trepomonas sp. PC1 TaxID=1076344 RepID=A0A146K5K6_9EUKA|eukprot:JAP91927.1 Hypothetical protein TPC1_16297 [Trepomonas sp. PC1]
MQSISLDLLYHILEIKYSSLKLKDLNSRSYEQQTLLSNDSANQILVNARAQFKIPLQYILQSSQMFSQVFSSTLTLQDFISIYQKALSSNLSIFNKYKFAKVLFYCIGEVLTDCKEFYRLEKHFMEVFDEFQKHFTLQNVLKDEMQQLLLQKILSRIQNPLFELITALEEQNLQTKIPCQIYNIFISFSLQSTLFNLQSNKMEFTPQTEILFDQLVTILAKQFNQQKEEIQMVFCDSFSRIYQSIGQLKEPEILSKVIDKFQLQQEEIIKIEKLTEPMFFNYIECFQIQQEGFKEAVKLLCRVKQDQNPDYIIEMMILNTIRSRFKYFQQKYQQNIDKSIVENVAIFEDFFKQFSLEVDCQLHIYIPILCQLQKCERFINEDIILGPSQINNTKQTMPKVRENTALIGGISPEFSHIPMSPNKFEIKASPMTYFLGQCIYLLRNMIQNFKVNWSIVKGKGLFERISMLSLRNCLTQIESIGNKLYFATKQIVLQQQSTYSEEEKLIELNHLLPRDSFVLIVTPIISQAIQAEFDFIGYQIMNNRSEEVVEFDPFYFENQLKNQYKFQCSSVSDDTFTFINSIFDQIVGYIYLSAQSLQTLMSSLLKIVHQATEFVQIPNNCHELPLVDSVFSGESTISFAKKVLFQNFDRNFNDGFSSAQLATCLKNDQIDKQKIVAKFQTYFDVQLQNQIQNRVSLVENPRDMGEMYKVIYWLKLKLNSMCALQNQLQQLKATLFQHSLQFSTKGTEMIPILRPVVNDELAFSTLRTADCSLQNQYFEEIERIIQQKIDQILSFQANYVVFTGLRFVIQQTYCPTPAYFGFEQLLKYLHLTIQKCLEATAPSSRKAAMMKFAENGATVFCYLLTDSGKRARTISLRDHPQLVSDLTSLRELMSGGVFMADQCYQKYTKKNGQLINETELEIIFQRAGRIVAAFGIQSQKLVQGVNSYKDEYFKMINCSKQLNEIGEQEMLIRVLNFRRYDEDAVRTFMHNIKKRAGK